ncbi:hypothetical protein NP233_g5498 [Leucocoprinus birnbaumii]|uniref:PCI domain-containing protein n=1 Tax=Leucocoprinus birnbaumii TaxID=56174 RepID=A0AAD5YQW8_9AGAR|nr:hypothetical protein NP233_g5498 [Leucocoprinus birnbaumii]
MSSRSSYLSALISTKGNLSARGIGYLPSRFLILSEFASGSVDNMPMDFSMYLGQINDAVIAENGPNLAFLLRPTSPHGKDLVKEFRHPTKQSMRRYEGAIASPWDEIAISYVLTCAHIARKRYGEAFKEQTQLVSEQRLDITCIVLDIKGPEGSGFRLQADLHAKYNNQKSEAMEEAARVIAKAFSNCMTDRISPPTESRKWGIYYVVGLILKCYFRVGPFNPLSFEKYAIKLASRRKIKRISLSKNILRALQANDIPPLSAYPRSHQVTYRYYIGMLSFLNEDFVKAEEELTLAFYNCHVDAHSNQERILAYLIPLRIIKGHLPSDELMNRFPVLKDLYHPFISSIKTGDLAAFDRALDKLEHQLLELNLWFALEKAREICMRSLFRRAWIASDKGTRIPISIFSAALKVSGIETSEEETECFIANMIHRGYIRGYISHERQIVVLAQTNSFPRVVERPSPFATMSL